MTDKQHRGFTLNASSGKMRISRLMEQDQLIDEQIKTLKDRQWIIRTELVKMQPSDEPVHKKYKLVFDPETRMYYPEEI